LFFFLFKVAKRTFFNIQNLSRTNSFGEFILETSENGTDSATDINSQNGTKSSSIIEVLKNGPYVLLFTAQFSQNIGASVAWLALQFYIFGTTGSVTLMGLLSIIFWLPYVLFTPLAGVYTDRFDQRKIMLMSNLISLFASLGFVVIYLLRNYLIIETIYHIGFSYGYMTELHVINYIHVLWPLFILTFINSTAGAFFFPARNAYTRLVVKKKNLLVANSIGTTVYQIATIVGYVLAGIIASVSYLGSFIFDASTFAFSLTMIILLLVFGTKTPKVERPEERVGFSRQMKSIVDDIGIGYRTIIETPKISYMLVVFASAIFSFATFNVLFIVVLQGEMGLDESWYGYLQAGMGLTGIITALVFMRIGRINKKILLLNITLAGLAGVLFLFAFTRVVWLMVIILMLFGVGIVCINIPAPTLIQEQIPFEKQGRVFGAQQLLQGIARLVGMGIVALIADYILPKYIILSAAIFMAIVMILGMIYSSRKGLTGSDYNADGELFAADDLSIKGKQAIGK